MPDSTVILFFKKNGKIIKTWKTISDKDGNWSFFTDEIFKSGSYSLSAQTRDLEGNISGLSPKRFVKVVLAGLSIGPWIITYQFLFLILIFLIVLFGGIIVYLLLSEIKKTKKRTKEETEEALRSLRSTFNNLEKEISKRIEYFDSKPGLNQREKRIKDELMDILEKSEMTVAKEIKDIEKELS